MQLQLAGLPSPAAISRDASRAPTALFCWGSSFRPDQALQGVAADSSDALYSPLPSGADTDSLGDASYALYDFDLSSLENPSGPLRVELTGSVDAPDGSTRVFVGIASPDLHSWSWGETNPEPLGWSFGQNNSGSSGIGSGGLSAGRVSPWLPVVVVVFGNPELRLKSVQVLPDLPSLAAGPPVFRVSWNHQADTAIADDSMDIGLDNLGRLHFTGYDGSNGQLYDTWLHDRTYTTQAIDCDSDVGLSNSLVSMPDGGLALAYYDVTHQQGVLRTLAPDQPDSLVWSPRSNFDAGTDELGLTIDAGARCSAVYDDSGVLHVFYEDRSNQRIRHAWKPLGALDWLHDYVSPEAVVARGPVGLNAGAPGMSCVYMAENKLFVAEQDVAGWTSYELASDVFNPLDPAATTGFCDAAILDGQLTCAYSALSGGKVSVHDLSVFGFDPVPITVDVIFNPKEYSAVYVDLAQMGDGSVRLAHYCLSDNTVYFETGAIPTADQELTFTSLPAVQLGEDQDCDGLSFWADPATDAAGFHDVALGLLSSRLMPPTNGHTHTKSGHVSLLK